MSDTILTTLVSEVVARLKAELILTGGAWARIPVTWEDKHDVAQDLDNAVAEFKGDGTKAGISLLVLMPRARREQSTNYPGPPEIMTISVIILEWPVINLGPQGIGVRALSAARFVARSLHHFIAADLFTPLLNQKEAIQPLDSDLAPVALEVPFDCRDATDTEILKVARPVFAPTSGAAASVTISCGTAGAAIYYTTDGSHPWTGNAAATLYSGAITVPVAGFTLRAAAYLSGSLGSDAARASFTQTSSAASSPGIQLDQGGGLGLDQGGDLTLDQQ